MASNKLTLCIKFAWWLRPAVHVYIFTCYVTGAEISAERVYNAVKRAARFYLPNGKRI